MLKILQTHHVAIIASNYSRSKHFYTKIIGLSVISETFRAERDSWKLDLALPGGMQIELFSFPHPPDRVSQPEACGLRHLAFLVENVKEAALQLRAQEVQVEPVRVDPITGKHYTFFTDPDGLPLELYEI